MTLRALLLAATAGALAACGDNLPPPVGPRDVPRADTAADDIAPSDVPVGPGDGATPDGGADATPSDASGLDATTPDVSAPDVSAPDVAQPDAADVPAVPTTCTFMPERLGVLAARYAICTFQAPQTMINTLFRPDGWEGGPLAQRQCAAVACVATERGGCTAVFDTCLKLRADRPTGGCATVTPTCNGTPPREAVTCTDGTRFVDNCTGTMRRCVAAGGEAACVPEGAAMCSAGAPARCNGQVLERCLVGNYTPVQNCALSGAVCDAASGRCVGTGPACTEGASSCDGTMLRVCRGGRFQTMDCGRIVPGASCQSREGSAFCGTATECNPVTTPASGTCDGNILTLCAGGRTLRFDCTLYGFTRCSARGCE